MKYIHYLLAGLTVGLSLLGFASFANANHAWGNYHWARLSTPFTLKLGDNVSVVWGTYLASASTDWSTSSALDTQIVAGASKRNCGPISGRVEVCNNRYGNNGWLGLATIWASGSHITQGTVKMNDTYFATATYNSPAWRQMVLCQEVGHTFGLAHQDENFSNSNLGTCMDYTNNPARNDGLGNNVHPNAHDYSMLEAIYSHFDTSTTISQSTSSTKGKSANEEDLDNDPSQWGREVDRSADGKLSLFEKDLGNGKRIFRHVFWVESRKGAHQE